MFVERLDILLEHVLEIQNSQNRKKCLVRVFTIFIINTETNLPVVIGKLSIFSIPVLLLFNYGAKYSFVSIEYLRRLGKIFDRPKIGYSMNVLYGDVQQTNLF